MTSLTASFVDQRTLIRIGLLLVAGNLLTLFTGWSDVAGVLILGVFLPGILAAAWLLHRAFPPRAEFIAYSLGLGLLLYVLTLLGVVVLPGQLQGWQVLLAFNLLSGLLAIGWWRAQRLPAITLTDTPLDRWALVGLVSVLVVAALLRLPNLGYSDFQGDEARAMLRAAEVIQGYPSALVIHKKGPAEILLPTGIYAVQGMITEAQARFPFTLAGMVGILAIYLLGWRMFGAVAGWIAAMLLAVDGYFIGFARIVQYQSVVFCMSVLVVLAIYRQARSDRPMPAYLLLAGLCFVGSLYAHYEALWVLIPGLYLLYVYVQRTENWRGLLRALSMPVVVTLGLLLLFYVPFLLDARWDQTARDVFGNRIGNDFPYNNLRDFFERTTIYDSAYQAIFMIIAALLAQAIVLRQAWPRLVVWGVVALTAGGLAFTFFTRPDWLRIGGMDHTWIFFALAIGVVVASPRIRAEDRAVWLWFGVPMVLSIFFVSKPNSHVYGFFMGWALVIGSASETIWQGLQTQIGLPRARLVALPAALILLTIFANYAFLFFTYTGVEVLRTWTQHRPWGYWTPYTLPTRGSLFGLPYKNGWKVVGALYADGTLDAPFTSNETSRVGDWYSRGLHFCPPDAQYYMLPTTLQPDEALEDPARLQELEANGFRQWGVVTVKGDPRLRIFTREPGDEPVRVFEESDYARHFDIMLTSPFFLKTGPALLSQPATPVAYRLGEHMWLKGYTLPRTQVEAGEQLQLQLFWEMAQAQDIEDKVFIQLIDLNTLVKVAQRDSEPGCSVYSMDEWRANELNLDPYTLTIAPDAPLGSYTLLVGAYNAESQERFPVFNADGSPIGDAIPLTTIEVVEAVEGVEVAAP